jgi:hypothetical protein
MEKYMIIVVGDTDIKPFLRRIDNGKDLDLMVVDKQVHLENESVILKIVASHRCWVSPKSARGAFIIIKDTDLYDLEIIKKWKAYIDKECPKDIPIILLIDKTDVCDETDGEFWKPYYMICREIGIIFPQIIFTKTKERNGINNVLFAMASICNHRSLSEKAETSTASATSTPAQSALPFSKSDFANVKNPEFIRSVLLEITNIGKNATFEQFVVGVLAYYSAVFNSEVEHRVLKEMKINPDLGQIINWIFQTTSAEDLSAEKKTMKIMLFAIGWGRINHYDA